MFEAPGSSIKYVAVTEKVARKECAPLYFPRGQVGRFREVVEGEDGEGEGEGEEKHSYEEGGGESELATFEEYREKSRATGVM